MVIAIIGTLIGMLLPAVQRMREAARRSACSNSMKQLSLACLNYQDARRKFPAGWGFQVTFFGDPNVKTDAPTQDGRNWGFLTETLNYIEQADVYNRCAPLTNTISASGQLATVVPTFLCPSDSAAAVITENNALVTGSSSVARSNYRGVMGDVYDYGTYQRTVATAGLSNPWGSGYADGYTINNGMYYLFVYAAPRTPGRITDGLSKTLALGERVANLNWAKDSGANASSFTWTMINTATPRIPLNLYGSQASTSVIEGDRLGFSSNHPGGVQFSMVDGSVAFVADTVDAAILQRMSTISGGESQSLP